MAVTQTDIQQMIQGLTPTAVNNGNPNTAYNFAPPSTDAQGNWFGGGVGPAASLGALQLTPVAPWTPPAPPAGGAGSSLLDLLPSMPTGGIPTNPNWSPTPMPNPSTGGGGGTSTGGGQGPQGQGWNDGPAQGVGGNGSGGGAPAVSGINHDGGLNNWGPSTDPWGATGDPRDVFMRRATSLGLPMAGGPNGTTFDTSRFTNNDWGKLVNNTIGDQGFWEGGFGKALGNILDVVIPGNAFDSDTGWDFSNAVTGTLNRMIPFAQAFEAVTGISLTDKAIEQIAQYYDNNPDAPGPDWLKDMVKDHVEDQKKQKEAQQNRKNERQGGGGGGAVHLPGYGGSGPGAGWGFGQWISDGNRTGSATVGPMETME